MAIFYKRKTNQYFFSDIQSEINFYIRKQDYDSALRAIAKGIHEIKEKLDGKEE